MRGTHFPSFPIAAGSGRPVTLWPRRRVEYAGVLPRLVIIVQVNTCRDFQAEGTRQPTKQVDVTCCVFLLSSLLPVVS